MITVKTPEEIEILREGGRRLAAILELLKKEIRSGTKTKDLDTLAEKLILEAGGLPSFKGYKNYPAAICVSVNDEVVHGIPSKKEIKTGDVVGLDIGIKYRGLFTDMAETIIVGKTDEIGERLVKVTKEALELAVSKVRSVGRVGDIGEAVQKFVEAEGFGVVRNLVGHGVGYKVHEDPQIPNWGRAGRGPVLKENMVIALEPMVTAGGYEVYLAPDGWTWKTKDGSRSAHFEHTLVVKKDGAEILTKLYSL